MRQEYSDFIVCPRGDISSTRKPALFCKYKQLDGSYTRRLLGGCFLIRNNEQRIHQMGKCVENMRAGYADAPAATTPISLKYVEISGMVSHADLQNMELSRTL